MRNGDTDRSAGISLEEGGDVDSVWDPKRPLDVVDSIDAHVEVAASNGRTRFKRPREGGRIVEVGTWVVMNEPGRLSIWVDNQTGDGPSGLVCGGDDFADLDLSKEIASFAGQDLASRGLFHSLKLRQVIGKDSKHEGLGKVVLEGRLTPIRGYLSRFFI